MKRFLILAALLALLSFPVLAQQTPIVKTQTVALEIKTAPDFNMTVTPPTITTYVNRTVAYNITLESVNDFAGEIVLEVTGLPANVTAMFFPSNTVTIGPGPVAGIQVNVEVKADAPVGSYQLIFKATSTNYN